MDRPQLLRFRDRLAETQAVALHRGTLGGREYDALLLDPDFDDAEFEKFRSEIERAGLSLPETDADRALVIEAHLKPDPSGGDLMDRYLADIGRIPLLRHEELLSLARQARAGDALARKRIILGNLRLVVFIARRYQNRGLPFLDLIEDGNIGLIHATDRFEPARNLRFSTYASIWIRQAILRGIAEQSRSVRIPVQMFQQVNRFVRIERDLRARLGRDPRMDEVAESLGISPARTERLAGLVVGLRSLDEGSSLEAFEQLTHDDLGNGPPSVERLIELQLENEKIDRLLRSLSQREEQILRIRYGFYDGDVRTLAQTGEHFGISRERVRQIEARALMKLRTAIELQDLDRAGGPART